MQFISKIYIKNKRNKKEKYKLYNLSAIIYRVESDKNHKIDSKNKSLVGYFRNQLKTGYIEDRFTFLNIILRYTNTDT